MEAMCIKGVVSVMGIYKHGLLKISGDNTVALGMSKEAKLSDASNNIAIQYHYILFLMEDKSVDVQ